MKIRRISAGTPPQAEEAFEVGGPVSAGGLGRRALEAVSRGGHRKLEALPFS